MLVALRGECLESSLPHVPAAAVSPVVAPDVAGHKPLHPAAEVGIALRPEDEMEVVRHEGEPQNRHGEALAGEVEEIDEGLVVVGVVENLGAGVAPVEDVIKYPGRRCPCGSRHEERLPRGAGGGKGQAGRRRRRRRTGTGLAERRDWLRRCVPVPVPFRPREGQGAGEEEEDEEEEKEGEEEARDRHRFLNSENGASPEARPVPFAGPSRSLSTPRTRGSRGPWPGSSPAGWSR
jgi:hypothetical protein